MEKAVTENNRQAWKVLISAMIVQLFLGIVYVWGVFVIPVSEMFSWNVEAVKLTASFKLGFFVFGMIIGGKMQVRMCASRVVLAGGLMGGVGLLVASFTPIAVPWLLYVTYGVICGFGSGMGYIASITAAQKWFPKRRGFATGLCVGAFGLSVTIFAPVIEWLLATLALRTTLHIMSAAFFVVTLLLGRLVKFPEETPAAAAVASNKPQYTSGQMLRKKEFYLITISLLLITGGFFVINPAVQTLSVYRGFDLGFATILLMIVGASNAFGRIVIPIFSDRVGNERMVLILTVVTMLAAFTLIFATGPLFVVMVALIPICFGAALSVFPLITADYFGIKNLGSNYGMVTIGFAFSALVLPGLISLLGGYSVRFIAVTALAAAGIVVILALIRMKKKADAEELEKAEAKPAE